MDRMFCHATSFNQELCWDADEYKIFKWNCVGPHSAGKIGCPAPTAPPTTTMTISPSKSSNVPSSLPSLMPQSTPKALETNDALTQAVQDWVTYGRDDVSDYNSYGPIEEWDVSLITSMDNTFKDSTDFNENISAWDVTSVSSMNSMFRLAESFDGDISGWDVSGVTGMDRMFCHATSFNQELCWDADEYKIFKWNCVGPHSAGKIGCPAPTAPPTTTMTISPSKSSNVPSSS